MVLLGFLLVVGFFFRYEYTRIRRFSEAPQDMVAFIVLMCFAVVFAIVITQRFVIFSPIPLMEWVFDPISRLFVPPA